jgi:propanediol dehydratase small subunit
MAIEDEVPDVEEFDEPDLRLTPESHQVQAEMAAERGEEYDPHEFERRVREQVERMRDPFDDAEPVE